MTPNDLIPFIERMRAAEAVLTLAKTALAAAEHEHDAAHQELTVALDQLDATPQEAD